MTASRPEVVRETVFVGGATFRLDRPAGRDAADEPYWSNLWPAARMLAKAVLREPWETYPVPAGGKLAALEVACGLGLPGVAALSRGLRVAFSDRDDRAVRFAAANARLNGFADFTAATLDVLVPLAGVQYPVVLGSDLLYEPGMAEPLVGFLRAVLAPGGVALIADPDRPPAKSFRGLAEASGLTVTAAFARAGEPGGGRTKGTVYRVTKPPEF